MVYVALLRGINVGGNNKVEMAKLKLLFEGLGLAKVKTYINSGNVIFTTKSLSQKQITESIEVAIHKEFGFEVPVVVRNLPAIEAVAKAVPRAWANDAKSKTDVMFLWEDIDNEQVLKELIIKPNIDTVRYVVGAVIWRVDRADINKSGLLKIVGTPLYKRMTIRNINTLRKLTGMMQGVRED